MRKLSFPVVLLLCLSAGAQEPIFGPRDKSTKGGKALSKPHPRLFGSAEQLVALSKARPALWAAVLRAADAGTGTPVLKARTLGLASIVTADSRYARAAIADARKIVAQGLTTEHVEFENRMWPVAETYDLCHAWLTAEDRELFIDYLNKMFDANNVPGVDSWVGPFHNSHLRRLVSFAAAGYATHPENPRALEILEHVKRVEWGEKLVPALREFGAGGGWWEGRGYDTYSHFQFLTFADLARRLDGFDVFALQKEYFEAKCAHEMFSNYPGFHPEGKARRACVSGDGKDAYGGFPEMTRAARLILADAFRDRPAGQWLAAYNEATPQTTIPAYAVLDFLYPNPPSRPLSDFKTSHLESGPGTVFMRSSWDEDAVWARFQCGDHFTWHQHYDQNSFEIFHGGPLATTGGVYTAGHDTNYYVRSVAHNTVLVYEPGEKWTQMRDGQEAASNDGGQAAKWGAVHSCPSAEAFRSQRSKWETGDLLAYGTLGSSATYACGDATAAYAPSKMKRFVRHFLFLRPHTFVVYDVIHTKPGLKATWVLNSINAPELKGDQAIVKTGPPEGQPGQLSVRRVLPDAAELRSVDGYRVDGKRYPPQKNDPRSGHFRLEADSTSSEGRHSFLFVLSTAPQAPSVRLEREGGLTGVDVDGTKILFPSDGAPGGRVASKPLPTRVLER